MQENAHPPVPRANRHAAAGIRLAFSVVTLVVIVSRHAALADESPVALESHDVGQANIPEDLSTSDWSSIRAAYEANRHAAVAVDDGYQTRNPRQQWRTRFDGNGFVTTPDAGGWTWGLQLMSYGREGAMHTVASPSRAREQAGSIQMRVEVDGGRVAYEWSDALTEWYINDTRGLEHGYTVHRRPDATSCAPSFPRDKQSPDREGGVYSEAQPSSHLQDNRSLTVAARFDDHSLTVAARKEPPPLQFMLAVRGDLRPRISSNGRNVAFLNASGTAVVHYNGLTVFDADGAAVPARFESAGEGLRLIVDDRIARYPLTIDPIAQQQAYLKASNTDGGDEFGYSVAVSGETVIVGAPREDSSATGVDGDQDNNSASNSGAAYVFVRDAGGMWSQQAYLKASNTDAGDEFGWSVAVSDDTVVVGAWDEDSGATGVDGDEDDDVLDSGAAYVFVRDVGGTWSQQAYLKASNPGGAAPGDSFGDLFGRSVAVSGDTVVVGSPFEDSSATGVDGDQTDNGAFDSGAAYVFVRDASGVWSQQAYLKASNTGVGDGFGWSVAVSDDTVVVGARLEDSSATGVDGDQADNSALQAGAAYVFVRDANRVWIQQAYLKASNTDGGDHANDGDRFGWSVSVSGDAAVVGAYGEASSATGVDGNQDDNSYLNSGAAYIFVRDAAGIWSQQAYLKASNTDAGDRFGNSVALSGDTVVVGSHLEDSCGTDLDGNQADNGAQSAGSAFIFVRNAEGVWSQQAYLKASNTDEGDLFGISVAVSGETVVVGASGEDGSATGVDGNQDDNSAGQSGAAYVLVICGADSNGDGVVDLDDYVGFTDCIAGPGGGLGDDCDCFDLTGNGDVDLRDFAAFQNAIEQ